MAVLMFQPQFADKVESGQKRQTIRPRRNRPIKVGDKLSLRKWSGKAYRSKQVVLRESECVGVSSVKLWLGSLGHYWALVDGISLTAREIETFAVNDGFQNAVAMAEWFDGVHGLPFEGDLIQWEI